MKIKMDLTCEDMNVIYYALNSALATAKGYTEMYKDNHLDNGYWKLEADRLSKAIKAFDKWEIAL